MPAPSGFPVGKQSAPVTPNFVVTNHGSLFTIEPKDDLADAWLREHVTGETTWWGGALVVEPRYLEALVAGAREEGWMVA